MLNLVGFSVKYGLSVKLVDRIGYYSIGIVGCSVKVTSTLLNKGECVKNGIMIC